MLAQALQLLAQALQPPPLLAATAVSPPGEILFLFFFLGTVNFLFLNKDPIGPRRPSAAVCFASTAAAFLLAPGISGAPTSPPPSSGAAAYHLAGPARPRRRPGDENILFSLHLFLDILLADSDVP